MNYQEYIEDYADYHCNNDGETLDYKCISVDRAKEAVQVGINDTLNRLSVLLQAQVESADPNDDNQIVLNIFRKNLIKQMERLQKPVNG